MEMVHGIMVKIRYLLMLVQVVRMMVVPGFLGMMMFQPQQMELHVQMVVVYGMAMD